MRLLEWFHLLLLPLLGTGFFGGTNQHGHTSLDDSGTLADATVTRIHAHTGAANGGALSLLETGTWAVPARDKDVIYQNTSGRKRRVSGGFNINNISSGVGKIIVGSANPPTTILKYFGSEAALASSGSSYFPFYFEVPNNYYYKVATLLATINLDVWNELDE